MTIVVAEKASLASLLRSLRGEIVDARPAYPEILHVEVRDRDGDLWLLATQDAEWTPLDPAALIGQTIEGSEIDEKTGELRCRLAGGAVFAVQPAEQEAPDDPCNWELITPGGVALEYGPGFRWQISDANAPPVGRNSD
ncbi:MAG: hypothetical protein ACJ75T_08395 [Solirubrobacterales bacterium]